MPEHREARFLLAAVIVAGLLVALVVLPYLNTLLLGVVLGITFMPIQLRIRKHVKSDGLAALLTLLVALVLVVTPLAFFAYEALGEAAGLYVRITQDHTIGELAVSSVSLAGISSRLPVSLRDILPETVNLAPFFQAAGEWVLARVGSFFGAVTGFALHLFLLLVGTYYVLKDGRRLVAYLVKLAPVEMQYEDVLFRKLHASVISVVRGSIAIAVLQGAVAALGFLVFGVPNAALWGAATMVASLVPIIGTALTMVPAVLYLLATGSVTSGLLLALWGLLIVGLVDNGLRAQIMKKGMDVHPFLILLSVLGGLEFFGPTGFISGPLLLAVTVALLDIYVSYRDRYDRALDASATLKS